MRQPKKYIADQPILDDRVGKYEKHPFFVKKAALANSFLEKAGLPTDLKVITPVKKPAQIFVSFRRGNVDRKQFEWIVKSAGSAKPVKVTSTQKEAIDTARAIARNNGSEVIIMGKDGRIRDRNSHLKARR